MVYWIACYKNGKQLKQGEQGGYDRLDRNGLEAFVLMFQDKQILTIWLDDDRQLIWRLRREIRPGGGEMRCHLVGWREKIGDKTTQTLSYVFEQYNKKGMETVPLIHIAGKFDRTRNRFMNEPKFREFEVFKGESWYTTEKIINEDGTYWYKEIEHIKE